MTYGLGGKGDEGINSLLQRIPGSIGYVSAPPYASQEFLCVAIGNNEGRFVLPTEANISASIEVVSRTVKDL